MGPWDGANSELGWPIRGATIPRMMSLRSRKHWDRSTCQDFNYFITPTSPVFGSSRDRRDLIDLRWIYPRFQCPVRVQQTGKKPPSPDPVFQVQVAACSFVGAGISKR